VRALQLVAASEIDAATLDLVLGDPAGRIDLLIVGTGAELAPLPAPLRAKLRAAGVGCETMATGAAVRTYNILIDEGRRVAALLIAFEMSAPPIPRAAELAQHYALCERRCAKKTAIFGLPLVRARARRRHLHALYAFALEIDDVRAKVTQPLLGEMRCAGGPTRWPRRTRRAAPPIPSPTRSRTPSRRMRSRMRKSRPLSTRMSPTSTTTPRYDGGAAGLLRCDRRRPAAVERAMPWRGRGKTPSKRQANAIARGALADAGRRLR